MLNRDLYCGTIDIKLKILQKYYSRGNLWKIACMHFYYGLVMILSALTLGLITNILTNLVQSPVISVLTTLGTVLLSYVIVILVQSKMITSFNELYKYIVSTKEEEMSN